MLRISIVAYATLSRGCSSGRLRGWGRVERWIGRVGESRRKSRFGRFLGGAGGEALKGTRDAYFGDGFVSTPVYDRYALRAGTTIAFTEEATFLPATTSAAARRSPIRELVQEPMNTRSTAI